MSWTGLLSVVICKGKFIINREIESVTDSEVYVGRVNAFVESARFQ